MNPPGCEWCGAPATCLVDVEPARLSAPSTQRKQNRLVRQLPACHQCRARLAGWGHKHFKVTAQGWADYWAKRQGRLL